MKYKEIFIFGIIIILSSSVYVQVVDAQNVKITDQYPVEQNSQYNGFFKKTSRLGLSPIHKLGGKEFEDSERNFNPYLSLRYAGDLNGDGYDDFYYTVTAADETTSDMGDRVTKTVILNGSPSGIDVENSFLVRDRYTFVADLNGDGQPESIQYKDGTLSLIKDESNGSLETVVDINLINMTSNAEYRSHGDFNGDGIADLLVYTNYVVKNMATKNYMIYGASELANISIDTLSIESNSIGKTTEYYQMAYSDIDNDSNVELVKVSTGINSDDEIFSMFSIYNINGTGDLELASQDTLWGGVSAYFSIRNGSIGLFDFNGDGKQELHVHNDGLLSIYKLKSDSVIAYDLENPVLSSEVSSYSIIGDFDNNGSEELLVYSPDFVKYLSSDDNFNITETDFGVAMQEGDYLSPTRSLTEDYNSSGDINGDGLRDIVVGFSNSEKKRYGYRVHFGNSSGSLIDTVTSEIDNVGWDKKSSVRYAFNAGDFNSDGKEDFGVVYSSGLVEIYLDDSISDEMVADLSVEYASSVFSPSIGDINGDGIDDVLISNAVTENGANDGAINIYLGGSSPDLDSDHIISFSDIYPDTTDGSLSNAQFIGDINNDGFDDIMFTSEFIQDVTHIMYGGSTLSATSDEKLPYFAMNFSKLGDFNGDGLTDYAVANTSNSVLIYSGFNASSGGFFIDQPMLNLAAPKNGSFSFYGHSITSGDFNGDNLADLAITSVYHQKIINNAYQSAAAIRLYAGSTSPDSLVDGKIYLLADDYALNTNSSTEDTLSRNVGTISAVPDQNGDGKDELLFSGSMWVTNAGVYYGGDLDTMGTNIDVYLEAPNQNLGLGPYANYIYAARGTPAVGDFNNDGKNEYLLPQMGELNFQTDPIYVYKSDRFSVANEEELTVVSDFELHQNYPNPFNPTTKISYNLPVSGHVKVQVFDITGRLISTIVDKSQVSGKHILNFDASALASGIYIYRLQSAGLTKTRKMTLIK